MTDQELIRALNRLKVETGSLACMGCGHEHNCGIHGCAIIRGASDRLTAVLGELERVTRERDAAVEAVRGDCTYCTNDGNIRDNKSLLALQALCRTMLHNR